MTLENCKEVILNPVTGNHFLVVAKGEVFKAGIRFWSYVQGGNAVLQFRFRIIAAPGAETGDEFSTCASNWFPNTSWNGRSSIHVSVVGHVATKISYGHLSALLKAIQCNDTGAFLFDMLQERFRSLNFLLDRTGFQQYFEEEMERIYEPLLSSESVASAPVPDDTVIEIALCDKVRQFSAGKEVSQSTVQPIAPEIIGVDIGIGDDISVSWPFSKEEEATLATTEPSAPVA